MKTGQPKKLLDEVRDLMRVRRYALRTERAYYECGQFLCQSFLCHDRNLASGEIPQVGYFA